LVGLFITLQALSTVFELGIGVTLNRELARLSAVPGNEQRMRDVLRSLQVIFWSIGGLLGVVVIAMAPVIADHWLQNEAISTETVRLVISIMGVNLAVQFLTRFYVGGLLGLERQVSVNILGVSAATLRSVGVILVLWLISPTAPAFFLWHGLIAVLHLLTVMVWLWHSLPSAPRRATFSVDLLRSVAPFAVGMTAISVIAAILTQSDKLILSGMLSLEEFGYYALAWIVAHGLYRVSGPVYLAVFPRFCKLVELNDTDGLQNLYHFTCQLISVLILPAAIFLAFFSREILDLWVRDAAVVDNTYVLVSLLAVGKGLHALMLLPYGLQLAHGWTRLTLFSGIVALVVFVPGIVVLVNLYAGVGAAVAWLMLRLSIVLIVIPLMHRHLLPGQKYRWYIEDVGAPLVAALLVCVAGRLLFSVSESELVTAVCLTGIWLTASAMAALAARRVGRWIIANVGAMRVAT
jgi:O-antigen/teichoic acid export membrane protein